MNQGASSKGPSGRGEVEDDDGGEVEMGRVGVGESDEGKEAKSQERDES